MVVYAEGMDGYYYMQIRDIRLPIANDIRGSKKGSL
jgi:hypothetical protein